MRDESVVLSWRDACQALADRRAGPDEIRQAWEVWAARWPRADHGPPPMWFPDDDALRASNLARWMEAAGFRDYRAFHRWSITHRAEFWQRAIERLEIEFAQPPRDLVDLSGGPARARWLTGARLNIAAQCFRGPSDRPAVLYGRAEGTLESWTLAELKLRVERVAQAIGAAGFSPGTPLAVVLPMTADAVALYLGIVWAGCVAVSIADSFAPAEIANRLRIGGAQAVFTYDASRRSGKRIPLYERVCQASDLPAIVLPTGQTVSEPLRAQDTAWADFLSRAVAGPIAPHVADADEAINILFSSGTTGDPKAIPWTHLTPLRCAIDGHCHQDIRPGHVCCWPTNLGWMMGPWLIFASLINRGTVAIYEDAPTQVGFGEFVQQARVNMLGVVPTIVKSWRANRAMEPYDWSAIHVFSSTGESSQRDEMFYLSSLAGVRPVIEYCGGTEIGGGFITSTVVQPNVASAFSTPAVGLDVVILDEAHRAADDGELFIVPPSIGLSTRLLNRDHFETYYEGVPSGPGLPPLRRHGDHFRRLPGGYYEAGGRVDDTMNLGGIKISSAELERVLNRAPGVRETAAVGVSRGGPEELVVFAVVEAPVEPPALLAEMNRLLKVELNPLFRAAQVAVVESLPRTASNKVMRRVLRDRLLAPPAAPARGAS